MATITIHAGDFKKNGSLLFGSLHLHPVTSGFGSQPEIIPLSRVVEIDIATEASVRKVGGVIGWGAVGAVVAGPAGILAAILLGAGKRKEVTFVARLTDGRKMLATTDGATYTKLAAAAFNASEKAPLADPNPNFVPPVETLPEQVYCPTCHAWSPASICVGCGADKPRDAPKRAG
jgi:hypothetical protein